MASDKPRVAFFDFACCEGCQLTVLSIGEPIIDLLGQIEIVTWREAMSEKSDQYDIAFVEGSISRDSDIERLKTIRERASILVALGSCAALGGPHVSANNTPPEERVNIVYGSEGRYIEAGEVRPLGAVVPVDVPIYGCPINADEFVSVVKHLLLGRPYRVPDRPVCHECKLNQYECVYDRGQICLGPVTRGGCNAICTSRGGQCFGCRGLLDDPNVEAAREVLEEHGYKLSDILGRFDMYSQRAQPRERISADSWQEQQATGKPEPWR